MPYLTARKRKEKTEHAIIIMYHARVNALGGEDFRKRV
jgi:hypothetical protein